MASIVLVRGAGDLATGVIVRLVRAGLKVVATEISQPLAVRRKACFSEAVYTGETTVEGITAHTVKDPSDSLSILTTLGKQLIPVVIDPTCVSAVALHPVVIIDARMLKRSPELIGYSPQLYIGLGPGFIAGENCQAVIETQRGHYLGRVKWQGAAERDSGKPSGDLRRVLRTPVDGVLSSSIEIGERVKKGQVIAKINGNHAIESPFDGVLRGLIHTGNLVTKGMKVGDVDPRDDPHLCTSVSEKALAVGGGVLEAILTKPEVRAVLWQ